jgi:hypothetical protein
MTRLLNARLSDPTAEEVRTSHARVIEELQKRIERLEREREKSGWEFIDETIHRGSATDKLILRGDFNADRDREYLFEPRLLLATGTSHRIRLAPGGTAVGGSDRDSNVVRGTSLTSTDELTVWNLTDSFSTITRLAIDVRVTRWVNGPIAYHSEGVIGLSGAAAWMNSAGTDFSGANIRAWAIGSTVAGRILAGSTVTAWRRRRG